MTDLTARANDGGGLNQRAWRNFRAFCDPDLRRDLVIFCGIKRRAEGKLPACVHNCQSKVMEYGDVEELAKKLTEIKKCVLFAPGEKE